MIAAQEEFYPLTKNPPITSTSAKWFLHFRLAIKFLRPMNFPSPKMSYNILCVFYVLWLNHCKNVFPLRWDTKVTSYKITYTERHYIRDGITQHAGWNGTIQSQNFICWVLTTPSMLLHYLYHSQIWYFWQQIKKEKKWHVYITFSLAHSRESLIFLTTR